MLGMKTPRATFVLIAVLIVPGGLLLLLPFWKQLAARMVALVPLDRRLVLDRVRIFGRSG